MKTKKYLFVVFLFLIFSCKNEKKSIKKEIDLTRLNDKVYVDSLEKSVANFEEFEELFKDIDIKELLKTQNNDNNDGELKPHDDDLMGIMKKLRDTTEYGLEKIIEGATGKKIKIDDMNFDDYLSYSKDSSKTNTQSNKDSRTKEEIDLLYQAFLKKDSLDAELVNAKKNGKTETELQAIKKEHKNFLESVTNDSEMVEELYAYSDTKKDTNSKNPIENEKLIIRSKLGLSKKSYLEEKLTGFTMYDEIERLRTIKSLKKTSKEKGNKIIARYFKVSEEELEILKQLPSTPYLNSTKDAQNILNYKMPTDIKKYLTNGNASEKFKKLVGNFSYIRKRDSKKYLKNSKKAKDKFYKDNPTWYANKNGLGKTYQDSHYNYIYLPLGELSFADKIIHHNVGEINSGGIFKSKSGGNSQGAIGEPDMSHLSLKGSDKRICNIGTKGVLTLAFKDNILTNVNGPDLFIFEMGKLEPTELEISKDGENWINIGKIEGGTAYVDIDPYVKVGDTFNYIRLTDLETHSILPGADIDAVAAIGGALRLSLDSEVLFEVGKHQLKKEGLVAISKLSEQIKTLQKGLITIEGHTDDTGSAESNQTLSKKRAISVANELKQLITSTNFKWKEVGYGESRPIVKNDSDENRQINRRVEILVMPTSNQ